MIRETITFKFENEDQQRRFHETLEGSDTRRIAELDVRVKELEAEVEGLKDAMQRAEEK